MPIQERQAVNLNAHEYKVEYKALAGYENSICLILSLFLGFSNIFFGKKENYT